MMYGNMLLFYYNTRFSDIKYFTFTNRYLLRRYIKVHWI